MDYMKQAKKLVENKGRCSHVVECSECVLTKINSGVIMSCTYSKAFAMAEEYCRGNAGFYNSIWDD